MMQKIAVDTFYPTSQIDWRQWLQANHCTKKSVWLVCYKKKMNIPTLAWSDAVDEALCFGWIDSKRITQDDGTFLQFFSKMKPTGTWSKVNKEKIRQLITAGLMTKAGYESIERAKQNGSWTTLDRVEELKIPRDLSATFKMNPGSKECFLSLSKSAKKVSLQWLVLAKRPETRQKRIQEIAELAVQNKQLKQLR